jgi:hypothetical protein
MMLFVACTGPPLVAGTRVAELAMEERDTEEEFIYVVPESWEVREDMVPARVGRLPPFEREPNIGAVLVRGRGAWADIAML